MTIKYVNNLYSQTVVLLLVALLSACSGGSSVSTSAELMSGSNTSNNPLSTTGGNYPNSEIPVAVADEVFTYTSSPIKINVLINDSGLDDIPLTINIPSLPAYGNVSVDSDNSVIFTPHPTYAGNDSFTYTITDINGDTSSAVVHLGIRCNAFGDPCANRAANQIPIAIADQVITDNKEPISINILSNDFGLGDKPLTITFPGLPSYGNLAVGIDNSITFMPNSDYTGKDSFSYLVTDKDGDSASAVVTLDIRCANCFSNQPGSLTLLWNANPDVIEGYIVSYGSTPTSTTQVAASLLVSSTDFNAYSPSLEIDVVKDLKQLLGNQVCFTIKAFNVIGESLPSEPACTSLNTFGF